MLIKLISYYILTISYVSGTTVTICMIGSFVVVRKSLNIKFDKTCPIGKKGTRGEVGER